MPRNAVIAIPIEALPLSRLVFGLIALSAVGSAAGQDAALDTGAIKSFRIVRASTPPTIDGQLDDDVWSEAAVVDDFHQSQPIEGAEPTEHTTVYVLYDDDAIYVGGRMLDRTPDQISAGTLRHRASRLGDDDRLAVILDPYNDRRSGFRFETNPNGVRNESIYQNVSQNLPDWDGIWEVASSINDEGWVTEMAIPFKSLSFDANSDTWGINFARAVRRRGEEIAWVSRNRSYNPSISGQVVGFEGLDQGVGLDVVPSLAVNRQRTFDPSGTETDSRPSLDLYYKVTPSLNAALTLNTDFSATEVDTRQVNLTRFNLFFPEKRGFFLQDTDIFEFGRIGGRSSGFTTDTATSRGSRENGRPFFSRRIGLNSATGMPVDLNYGAKLSGRVGRWSVGGLTVQQDEFQAIDSTDVFVGRASMSVLDESAFGFIVTDGDPNSNLDNSLVGTDFRYLNTRLASGGVLEADAWFQQSDTEGLQGEDQAYGIGISMPNRSGWRGGAALKEIQENFKPAAGFVNRTDIRDMTGNVGYTHIFSGGYLTSLRTGVDVQRINLLNGDLQSQVMSVRVAEFSNGTRDSLRIRYRASKEVLNDPFVIYEDPSDPANQIVIPAGSYSFNESYFRLATGSQRKLAGEFVYQGGDFYDGQRVNLVGEITWRPTKHFAFSLSYDWNEIKLPQGEFTTRLVQLRAEIPFSNRLSWINYIQYDNVSETMGVDSRLHWVQRDGRDVYLVLNHNLQDFDRDNSFHSRQSDLTLKINYTFRY